MLRVLLNISNLTRFVNQSYLHKTTRIDTTWLFESFGGSIIVITYCIHPCCEMRKTFIKKKKTGWISSRLDLVEPFIIDTQKLDNDENNPLRWRLKIINRKFKKADTSDGNLFPKYIITSLEPGFNRYFIRNLESVKVIIIWSSNDIKKCIK